MAAKFELYDASGNLQASSSSFCYFLRESGTLTSFPDDGVAPGADTYSEGTITTTVVDPLLVLRSTTDEFQLDTTNESAGTTTYKVWADSDSASVSWYIFGKAATPSSNFGVVLYDENGNCTFDSKQKPLLIDDIYLDTNWGSGTKTASSSLGTNSGVLSLNRAKHIEFNETGSFTRVGLCKCVSGGVQVTEYGLAPANGAMGFAIVDLTHI